MGVASKLLRALEWSVARRKHQGDIRAYIQGGRKPWSRGYQLSKFASIRDVLNDDGLMARFRSLESLPDGYGYGYDERVVEYP